MRPLRLRSAARATRLFTDFAGLWRADALRPPISTPKW
jgi:hypothetical protein